MNLKPEQIRDMNWAEIERRVTGQLDQVYRALLASPVALTTIELSTVSGVPLLTCRPRVSDLVDLGLAKMVSWTRVNGQGPRHGRYAAIPIDVARAAHEKARGDEVERYRQGALL